MFVTKNFEMRFRESVSKQFNCGQSEDEIANGAASNDQDAIQVSNA